MRDELAVSSSVPAHRHGDAPVYRSVAEEKGLAGPKDTKQRGGRRRKLPMSEDERPGADKGQDELTRLLGSDEHYGALIRPATLLLDGDTAAAETSRDSLIP